MILVTVGTHNQGFERLVSAMDELASELDEEVIIQYGSSAYIPVNAQGFQWTTSQQMQELTHRARVVVCHAAAGAILVTLMEKKPLVIVPRLREFGEVVDNHQLQLSSALDQAGQAIEVVNPTVPALRDAITRAAKLPHSNEGAQQLITELRKHLVGLASAKPGTRREVR